MIRRQLICIDGKASFRDCLLSCFGEIQAKFAAGILLGVNLFSMVVSDDDFSEKKKMARNLFHSSFGNMPISLIAQSPGDKLLAAEVWVNDSASSINYRCVDDQCYTMYSDPFGESLFALGLASDEYGQPLEMQSSVAFEKMEKVLADGGFLMDDVIRQWNYIPDILKEIETDGKLSQHYQVFNDVRQHYYSKNKQKAHYPAATGIGMTHGSVTIDFLALRPANQDLYCVDLANPRQINAFDYSQKILVGSKTNKKTPLFVRAKMIGNQQEAVVFVSGTASIIGEETVGIDDIAMQNRITAENIEELASIGNVSKSSDIIPVETAYMFNRVYIKQETDFEVVKQMCREFYGDIPTLYVQADVCRDNLLIEIESEVALVI